MIKQNVMLNLSAMAISIEPVCKDPSKAEEKYKVSKCNNKQRENRTDREKEEVERNAQNSQY